MGNSPSSGREELALGEPGQGLNLGQETPPRQAATVILLRGGTSTLEVLLVKRTEQARFMGGVWVFPGGAVDRHEGEDDAAHRAAAVRELREEAAIELDAGELVKYSRWITPAEVKVRFDTHFFLAPLPAGQAPRIDGEECVDLGWFTPAGALAAYARQEIALVFPTIRHLEELGEFATAADLLRHAAGREVRAVQPRIILGEEGPRVAMPGEPGYE
jgi:8-oxo-dGTP pyrophosphatase MutT (NUDIX family)